MLQQKDEVKSMQESSKNKTNHPKDILYYVPRHYTVRSQKIPGVSQYMDPPLKNVY